MTQESLMDTKAPAQTLFDALQAELSATSGDEECDFFTGDEQEDLFD